MARKPAKNHSASYQGNENKGKLVRSMSRQKNPVTILVKVVVDFTSACGCGRAILKSDGEPSIVALQEALKMSDRVIRILRTHRRETVSEMAQLRTQ